ncbi:Rac GTPase-activating protein 1 [Pseudolycoriella hygida]|uniref:Rac GTPase-activating protein 1 n=1 Tax=Pseudolycoriella hygida TaxID=35572 RepID=A0A9Q0MVG7_9DIPT|nr:Rac GTPase-activating protein 1 [Pseudolycoriella hygida]
MSTEINLSIVSAHDDLRRCFYILSDGSAETEFLEFARQQEHCRLLWFNSYKESRRLQKELDTAMKSIAELETKLYHARRILDQECKARRDAEEERDSIEKKMCTIREFLQNDENLKEETRNQLAFLNTCQTKRKSKLSADRFGNDINSTGSFLHNLSLTRSENDFLDIDKPYKTHRKSNVNGSFIGAKRSRLSTDGKRKSNTYQLELGATDRIVAQTKVIIPQDDGPIQAESSIQAIPMNDINDINDCYTPSAPVLVEEMTPKTNTKSAYKNAIRSHNYNNKTFIRPDTCNHCQKKIKFGTSGLRCRNCRVQLHINCEPEFRVACVPHSAGTPNSKGMVGSIADYAPNEPPMVPAIIVHCINEIEKRGLNEVGIYRVSGSEREIKSLKERFIRGKTLPYLGEIDIHVLCGCVKDFLRHLREPLIPTVLWKDFCNATQNTSFQQSVREMYAAIDKLPQANRDTLAFILLHFLRVAECKQVKMPPTNIAKIFGPTLVGYSSNDPDQHAIFTETIIQAGVMEMLLKIPADYWEQFVNIPSVENHKDEGDNRDDFEIAPRYPRKHPFYATSPVTTLRKK